jgi:hypothetical protein
MNNSNTKKTEQLPENDVVCCGILEKMNINWMVLEDGTKIMPFITDKTDDTNWRVNNCPSCGVYVRDCIIKP